MTDIRIEVSKTRKNNKPNPQDEPTWFDGEEGALAWKGIVGCLNM